jgi:hypothetical protein
MNSNQLLQHAVVGVGVYALTKSPVITLGALAVQHYFMVKDSGNGRLVVNSDLSLNSNTNVGTILDYTPAVIPSNTPYNPLQHKYPPNKDGFRFLGSKFGNW